MCLHVCLKNYKKKFFTDNKFTAAKIQHINTQSSVHKYAFMDRTLCMLYVYVLYIITALSCFICSQHRHDEFIVC